MAEFEARIAGKATAVRVLAEDELEALDTASTLVDLEDGDEVTVYPADEIPVGADGDDAE